MIGIGLVLAVTAPWLLGIAVAWRHAPLGDDVPPSLGQRALERLQTV